MMVMMMEWLEIVFCCRGELLFVLTRY